MPVYEYEGQTKSGAPISGTIEAPSRAVATVRLRQQGLWIQSLVEQGKQRPAATAAAPASRAIRWSPLYGLCPVSAAAMGNFLDQLGSLLRAGIGMATMAQDLAARVSSSRLRVILLEIAPRVSGGEALSACLAEYPQVFPPGVIGMIRAGELTGNLDVVCQDMAAEYHAEQRVWWLLLIPKLYFGITLFIAALIPSFPWIILHGFRWWVNYALTNILPWMAVVLVAYLLYRMLWYWPALGGLKDRLAYSLPIWSGLTRRAGLARLYRALELLVRAGVDFPTAMNTAAQATGNRVMAEKLREAERRMRAGVMVADALATCPFISREAEGMLGTAALAGTFDQTIPHLAEQMKANRDNYVRLLRFSGVALAYVITSVIVVIVAVKGYMAILAAQLERASREGLL